MKQQQEESVTRRLEATVAVKPTIRIPMPVKMRAKQFMMFDAMKGLTEAIAEKERQYYPKRELTEERINELNQCLSQLKCGDAVTVKYYCNYGKQYLQLTDVVTKVDPFWKLLQIGGIVIGFSEIDEIHI